MERLTTNKDVSKIGMYELAYNSCYIGKDGAARYRDFEMDMDARDFARNLMVTMEKEDMPLDDDAFDDEILDNLQYDPFADNRGLIALFYRNLWAMADLRERLKAYEDAEEQGLLLRLPCKVGDTVFVTEKVLRKRKEYGAFSEKKIIFQIENRPKYVECKVVGISFKNKGNYIKVRYTGEFEEKYFDYETGYDYRIITDYIDMNFTFLSIGKKVFLTKEEAEQALEKMKGV